jgi:hypothetical protein
MVDFFNTAGRSPVTGFLQAKQAAQASAIQKQRAQQQQTIFQQQQQAGQAQAARQEEARGLIGQAISPEGKADRGQLLGQAFSLDPQQAQSAQKFLQGLDEGERAEALRENESLTKTALVAKSLPSEQRRPFLESARERAIQEGRDVSNLTEALQQDDVGIDNLINFQARMGVGIQELAKQQFIDPAKQEAAIAKEERAFGRQKELQERGFSQQTKTQQRKEDIERQRFERKQEISEREIAIKEGKFEQEKKKLVTEAEGLTVEVLGKQRNAADLLENAKDPQLKAAGFAERMEATNNEILGLTEEGFDPTSRVEAARGVTETTASPEFQVFKRARADFITAQLRRESGAVISEDEFDTEEKKFFPVPGDSGRVLETKRKARERAVENMKRESKGVFEAQQAVAERGESKRIERDDASINARGAELLSQGLSQEQVIEQLIQEGLATGGA